MNEKKPKKFATEKRRPWLKATCEEIGLCARETEGRDGNAEVAFCEFPR